MFLPRYVTLEDIQQARLIRRRRQTAQSNPETVRSSHNRSNDSCNTSCNVSEIGSCTSQERTENKRVQLKLAASAFSRIDTSLLYDPVLDQSYNGGESVCRYLERFRVYVDTAFFLILNCIHNYITSTFIFLIFQR